MASKAHIRAELHDWGITDEEENPEELLLRLMTQSYNRAPTLRNRLRTVPCTGMPASDLGPGCWRSEARRRRLRATRRRRPQVQRRRD